MDAGVVHVRIVVVHHRGALEVTGIQHLQVKVEGAPTQLALGKIKVAIQWAGVDHGRIWGLGAQLFAHLEPIGIQADLNIVVVSHVF